MCTHLGLYIGCNLLWLSTQVTKVGSAQCLSGDFRCHNGEQCIRGAYQCDGEEDCVDLSDEKDCDIPIADNFLLVSVIRKGKDDTSVRPQIYQFDVESGQLKRLLPKNPVIPAALAIDHGRKVLYYVERDNETIYSVSLDNATSSGVIFEDLSVELEGLAIDSSTQKLYFCAAGNDPKVVEISLTDEDKTQRIIYSGTNIKPRAIIVDETNSELYWTDWSDNPGIFVIGLEPGAQKIALITDDILQPNALAIDFAEEVMFWVDSSKERIESATLSGQGRTVLFQDTSHLESHYYAMALGLQVLYIADWTKGAVQIFNLSSKSNEVSNLVIVGQKTGLAFYSSSFPNKPRQRPKRTTISTVAPTYVPTPSSDTVKIESFLVETGLSTMMVFTIEAFGFSFLFSSYL